MMEENRIEGGEEVRGEERSVFENGKKREKRIDRTERRIVNQGGGGERERETHRIDIEEREREGDT